jgi:CelD/BcsL family acetyltransferase involved in cellulose biosynthesis
MFHVKFQGAGAGLCINDEEDAGQKLNHATMHETASEIPTARIESIGRARAVYQIQPLNDRRWAKFVTTNAQASLFHSPEWLDALRQTYGYEPIAFTTAPPGDDLTNGIVFCRVDSWLTGRRLVSLPFSDYCQPLVQGQEDLEILIAAVERELQAGGWRYIEMRPLEPTDATSRSCHAAAIYRHHHLDLRPDLETLFRNFHKSSIQRKIRRAEREDLAYREGSSESLLGSFYELLVHTRQRHSVPPQPKKWFRTLMDAFGEALKIRIALKDRKPVAAMLTIRYKDTLVYKYGGSDARFSNLGGMQLLYWKSIQEAKNADLQVFDLGRSDAHQSGLITFKRRWGATESTLTYCRCTASNRRPHIFDPGGASSSWKMRMAKRAFAHVPADFLSIVGTLLYKHVG